MSLREHLREIHERHGKLTASLVVAEAEAKDHPLHDRFEWSNAIAGPRYREIQAAEMIRSVKITFNEQTDHPQEVRAWLPVRDPEESGRYEPVETVAADPLLARMVSREMERDWRALKRRWSAYEEFWRLVQAEAENRAG